MNELKYLVVIFTITLILIVLLMFSIYGLFINKKSKLILQQKKTQLDFERELAEAQIEIKEEILNFVGQELHDNIGQKLSASKIWLNQLKLNSEPNAVSSIQEIINLIGETIDEVRGLSKNLISEQINYFGLIEAIQREVNRSNQYGSVEINLIKTINEVDINHKHALILFRMFQECFNNALKHSKAKKITIELIEKVQELIIIIEDNGIGFEVLNNNTGSGLRNIQTRAKLINTEIKINSQQKKGTITQLNYHKN